MRGDYEEATKLYNKSLEICENLGDAQGKTEQMLKQSEALNGIAEIRAASDEYKTALARYEQSWKIFQKLLKERLNPVWSPQSNTSNSEAKPHAVVAHEKLLDRKRCRQSIDLFTRQLKAYKVPDIRETVDKSMDGVDLTFDEPGRVLDELDETIQHERDTLQGVTEMLTGIAKVFTAQCRYQDAHYLCDRFKARWPEESANYGLNETLSVKGGVLFAEGEFDKAVKCYTEALSAFDSVARQPAVAATRNSRGLAYLERGDLEEAGQDLYKALDWFDKAGASPWEARVHRNQARVFLAQGNFSKAEKNCDDTLRIFRELGARGQEATTLSLRAEVLAARGADEEAKENYEDALKIFRNLKRSDKEAGTMYNLGNLLVQQADFLISQKDKEKVQDDALTTLNKALKLHKKIKKKTNRIHELIGHLFLDMGKVKKARHQLNLANDNASLGRLALVEKEYDKAEGLYEKAKVQGEDNGNVEEVIVACTGLGIANERKGDYEKAAQFFHKAIDEAESLRMGVEQDKRKTFFNRKIKGFYRTAPYEGLARILLIQLDKQGFSEELRQSLAREALRASEAIKARAFADAISNRPEAKTIRKDLVSDKDGKIEPLHYRLGAVRKALRRSLNRSQTDNVKADDVKPQIVRLKALQQDLIRDIQNRDIPRNATTIFPSTPFDLKDSAVKDDEWVIEYEVTDSGICIFLLNGKKVIKTLFKPIERRKLQELVQAFLDPIRAVTGKPEDQETINLLKDFRFDIGKRLSDILLDGILSELSNRESVIIVPDDCLGNLPFEMLVLNHGGEIKIHLIVNRDTFVKYPVTAGAQFFGDGPQVSYYQSISALDSIRGSGKAEKMGNRVLVMADPIFGRSDERCEGGKCGTPDHSDEESRPNRPQTMGDGASGRLMETMELGMGLKELYGERCELFTGRDASKRNLMTDEKNHRRDLCEYEKIVFATHGSSGEAKS